MRPLPGRLVLLGHPVHHSRSPAFQNAALRSAGIPLTYEALDVPPADLRRQLEQLVRERAAGNVTVPHKAAVFDRCDRRTPLAERAGAVNTFWVEDGLLVGDNTDVPGFDALAATLLGSRPQDIRMALLGAGGAAAAVLCAVEAWPGARVVVTARHPERARALAARFPALATAMEATDRALAEADVIVNATPLGLHPDDPLPFRLDDLRAAAVVIDLTYAPGETRLVREARTRGHRAADGLGMLVEQGALAFERWFGVAPDRAAMWAALATHDERARADA